MTTDLKKLLSETPAGQHWNKIGIFPHHGMTLPLSALHSKESCGIGEFFDLIPIIDWCTQLKMDVIQLLPLNDTGSDPSPYNALSAFTLNPIYLSLHKLPYLDEFPALIEDLTSLRLLTKSQRVAYHRVKIQKLFWLRRYFFNAGARLIKQDDFLQYIKENDWAIAYGLFKVLKDILEQSPWHYWPDELKKLSSEQFQALVDVYWPQITFYLCLQYLCHQQLASVKEYAKNAKVFLKGDVPILISPDSVDVWHHPELFSLDYAAGAPPDALSPQQQYWGFPLYRWDVKKKNGYSWWKKRLQVASNFFDLYRLDHVVGLFRIWAIPYGQPNVMGHFIPPDESLWIPQGKELLNMMLSSFLMLPVAEDLGTVSADIRHCLTQLGIPGTKVIRWERYWNEDRRFIPFNAYSPISMTCVSTHDSETLTLWWKDSEQEAREFAAFKGWEYKPELTKAQRKELLWDSHHTNSLLHINLLQEYLALFPDLVWSNPYDERINVPGKILPSNWTYRFRPSIEELVAHTALQQEIHEILLAPTVQALSKSA